MGRQNERSIYIDEHLKGDTVPATSGGFISIYKDDNELFIANVPTPNYMAENNSDSTVMNEEWFSDEDGEYRIEIYSSMYGLSWELFIDANESDKQEELERKFNTQYNEIH